MPYTPEGREKKGSDVIQGSLPWFPYLALGREGSLKSRPPSLGGEGGQLAGVLEEQGARRPDVGTGLGLRQLLVPKHPMTPLRSWRTAAVGYYGGNHNAVVRDGWCR